MSVSNTIQVEVAFGLPDRQSLIVVHCDSGASCDDAIDASGLAGTYPDAPIAELPIAIWGRPVDRGDRVKNGDRIELLRPLRIDPRDARRQLASEGQFMGSNANPDDA